MLMWILALVFASWYVETARRRTASFAWHWYNGLFWGFIGFLSFYYPAKSFVFVIMMFIGPDGMKAGKHITVFNLLLSWAVAGVFSAVLHRLVFTQIYKPTHPAEPTPEIDHNAPTQLCPLCDQPTANPSFCDVCGRDIREERPPLVLPDQDE